MVADQTGTPDAGGEHRHRHLDGAGAGPHRDPTTFTDAGAASWYDFARAIHEDGLACGALDATRRRVQVQPIPARDYPTPARRPSFSRLDCDSLHSALGLPYTHWRDGLRATLAELTSVESS